MVYIVEIRHFSTKMSPIELICCVYLLSNTDEIYWKYTDKMSYNSDIEFFMNVKIQTIKLIETAIWNTK